MDTHKRSGRRMFRRGEGKTRRATITTTTMANKSSSIFLTSSIFICVALIISTTATAVEASVDHHFSWVPTTNRCEGSIAECMTADGEFDMDSEINRRILATTQYISYGALERNSVPCSLRGASYYNCQAGAQANPYNRGCSAITRCRS